MKINRSFNSITPLHQLDLFNNDIYVRDTNCNIIYTYTRFFNFPRQLKKAYILVIHCLLRQISHTIKRKKSRIRISSNYLICFIKKKFWKWRSFTINENHDFHEHDLSIDATKVIFFIEFQRIIWRAKSFIFVLDNGSYAQNSISQNWVIVESIEFINIKNDEKVCFCI